jgi:hypothetical protein
LPTPDQIDGKQSPNQVSSFERLLAQDRFIRNTTFLVVGIIFLTTLIVWIPVEALSFRSFTNGHPASVDEIRLLFRYSLYTLASGFIIAMLVTISALFYRLIKKNQQQKA